MSILPQLERELLDAHDRQRRSALPGRLFGWRRPGGWSAAVLLGGGLTAAAVVALVVLLGSGSRPSPGPGEQSGSATAFAQLHAQVMERGWQVGTVYASGGGLYVIPTVPGHASNGVMHLAGPGREWTAAIPDPVVGVIVAGGWLWLTTNEPNGITKLWKLSPNTVTPAPPPILLPGSGTGNFVGKMASTPGRLWVSNGDRIDSVSLSSGHVSSIAPRPSWGYDIEASGSTLYFTGGEGNPGSHAFLGRLEIGSSRPPFVLDGLEEPYSPSIVGIGGGGIWITRFDGRMISAERRDLRTFRPFNDPGAIGGTKGLSVSLTAGILWVSQAGAGRREGYCADPRTGLERAPLPLPDHVSFVGADSRYVYYSIGIPGTQPELVRAPIDPRCR